MKLQVFAAILVAPWLAAGSFDDEAIKKEMKQLEGTWTILSLEVNGNPVSEDDAKKFKLVTMGDKWTVSLDGKTTESTYQVDPAKDPKTIDWIDAKGQATHGIYSLVDDTLQMCRRLEPNKPRPTEFVSPADSGALLVVWKRAKP
jgi:uncharacterized protein (TIGR03067 family)